MSKPTMTGTLKDCVSQIMTRDIGLYPYRISNRHSTEQRDLPVRLAGCWGDADEDLADNIWWTDDSHLNGAVNSHNDVHWGKQRPTEVHLVPLHSSNITIKN